MTTVLPHAASHVPLAAIASTAHRGRDVATSVNLAAGPYLAGAPHRAIAALQRSTGPTRCSRIIVANYPPHQAAEILEHLHGCPPDELAGARLAVEASAATPFLWLFVASCQVLWTQTVDQVRLS